MKPYLNSSAKQVAQIKLAGAAVAYPLGNLMLKLARRQGMKFLQAGINHIHSVPGGYQLRLGDESLLAQRLVLSAGGY